MKELPLSKARQERGDQPDLDIGGQDWAEKIAAEVAAMLSIPVVQTELAVATSLESGIQQRGSISRDMRPLGWAGSPGAQLLGECDDDFDSDTCAGHTLDAIESVLQTIAGPPDDRYESWSAFDVFVGYLTLDALIANTDRHAHNWAVLSRGPERALAPSYDHGRAFGSGLNDRTRATILEGDALARWCARGVTTRFDGGEAHTMLAFAAAAAGRCGPSARQHWLEQIHGLDLDLCDAVIEAVPELSGVARTFVMELLTTNRRRLIDGLD
ncbi:hypothetical protein [Williamsia sp. CHRR-6]|uniref:hypothetical protein n=1 Tax=Williamsia sp. CHRR-6 TaxID=2835871 RepID=UPI0027DE7132|nr:hypothetical protein [Williamsia sp. CHRR-6]